MTWCQFANKSHSFIHFGQACQNFRFNSNTLMKNSEESDDDIEDSAVWSSLIGNIVAIIISAYLWLLQQNPHRKNRSNFNPDQLNNALKDLKQLAQELNKQNEVINESQCPCSDETNCQNGNKNCKANNENSESNENRIENVEPVNTYTVEKENESNKQPESKSNNHNHQDKDCEICLECLNNATATTSSLKTSPINQEYRPYQEPEFSKKNSKCKPKKLDRNNIRKGIADAQRAIKYLQTMQEQFEMCPRQAKKQENFQKAMKKTTFQENNAAPKKNYNRTPIQYDSDYQDEICREEDGVQCNSSCSIFQYETIPRDAIKVNPASMQDPKRNRNAQNPKEVEVEQYYSEDSTQLYSSQNPQKPVKNAQEENCTYMKDPCKPCEPSKLAEVEENCTYMEDPCKPCEGVETRQTEDEDSVSSQLYSSQNPNVKSKNIVEEEICTYMEDPCKPCERKPNVPVNRPPRTAQYAEEDYDSSPSAQQQNVKKKNVNEESCVYMEDHCRPCERNPNVPVSRPPRPVQYDPRKQNQMRYVDGNLVDSCPADGRPCFVDKCAKGIRQPNVTAPVYQSAGNRGYAPRPRNPNYGGYPQQNYGQTGYSKIPASDSRRQDYQSMNQRQNPRGNYPQGYGNPKYEKSMNTLTVERMDASSGTGEFLNKYNQQQLSNQQFVQQMQQKQYENQRARQREYANMNKGREFKCPISYQQNEEVEIRQFQNFGPGRDFPEVRYRNEDLHLMPVAAIPLKTSSNTIDVSKCPRYLK